MKKGFTLAETIIGMSILAFLICIVAGVFVKGLSASKKSNKKVSNIILSSGMMDNIMLMKYNDIVDGDFDGTAENPYKINNFPPPPYPVEINNGVRRFFYKINVKSYGFSGKLKRITVTVLSPGITGEGDTSVTMESIKTQE